MTTRIGAPLLVAALVFGFSAGISQVSAASPEVQKVQSAQATQISARRHDRHYHRRYADQPYYPSYYGRPNYYAPAPIIPIPPFFGYGWEWW